MTLWSLCELHKNSLVLLQVSTFYSSIRMVDDSTVLGEILQILLKLLKIDRDIIEMTTIHEMTTQSVFPCLFTIIRDTDNNQDLEKCLVLVEITMIADVVDIVLDIHNSEQSSGLDKALAWDIVTILRAQD